MFLESVVGVVVFAALCYGIYKLYKSKESSGSGGSGSGSGSSRPKTPQQKK